MSTAQSPSESKGISGLDGPVSRHLNRPLSRRISAAAWRLPFTPDHWSYLSFALTCTGSAAFAVGRTRAGGLLIHAGSIIDGVDGEVARLQGRASAQGALLDVTLDRVSDVALSAGMALGGGGRTVDWLLAAAAINGAVTASMVKERVSAEGIRPADLQHAERSRRGLRSLLPLGESDGRRFAATVAGLAGRPRLGLAWLAAIGNARLLWRLHVARTALRRRQANLSRPVPPLTPAPRPPAPAPGPPRRVRTEPDGAPLAHAG